MADRVTLKSLAAQLGVDASLVSRVLRNDASVRVSAQTRARVLELAREIGYRPHPMGQALRTRRSRVLGMLIPDITNPFYSVLFQAVETVAIRRGHTVLLANTGESDLRLAHVLDVLCGGQVDGLLVATARDGGVSEQRLAAARVRHVLLNRRGEVDGAPWVGPDDLQTGTLAAEHLLKLGHRRIAYIGGDVGIPNMRLRQEGFLRCLAEHGIAEPERLLAANVLSRAEARRLTAAFLALPADRRPTALVVSNSVLPDGVLAAIRDAGLRVPQDISLVAYNPFDECYLSGIAVPVTEIGRIGTEWLIDQLAEGGDTQERLWRMLPVSFVDRGTTAPPRPRRAPRAGGFRQRETP